MNLQQLKAKYATQGTATAATAATVTTVTTVTPATESYTAMPGLFSRAVKSTVNITTAVAKTTRGVMPVSTRRFENIVGELNDKHENTDRELFKNKVMIHMIASSTGVTLPSEEELNKAYEEYDAYADETIVEQVEAVKEEVVTQATEEVQEVAATEEEPKKESKSSGGRRRLGRQKPIAE